MGELAERRSQTEKRLTELRRKLSSAEKIAEGKACVYATGSFGRGEASSHSDLDLFILGKNGGEQNRRGFEASRLKRLDEIRLKADLIEVTDALGIPEFSGDGRYLTHFSVDEFTKTLGTPEDDVTNTFTARLLLLLESRPLVGDGVYEEVIEEVLASYWKDFEDHKSNFMPAFLANDILRLWRTFCVNYEAGREEQPEWKKAKGKIKNYKLKHSRLLTCYSGILFLLATYQLEKTVTPSNALEMIKLSPTQRVEWINGRDEFAGAKGAIASLIEQYEVFLSITNAPEDQLIDRFMNKSDSRNYMREAFKFGNLMFDVLEHVGRDTPFYRLLVV